MSDAIEAAPHDSERWWPGTDEPTRIVAAEDGRLQDDQRSPFERDRDRLLYTDEFERLRGVTQVVSPTEGILCHDRHSHSLRVEQLAMRMVQNISRQKERPAGWPAEVPIMWVVAAAALAHDLGHPPFGHVAEQELDRLLRFGKIRDADGFEGNAQSFRIISRLAAHRDGGSGLRLTRRVLRATLKYPWLSNSIPAAYEAHRKYGAYSDDAGAFRFATSVQPGEARASRSLEAAIMDAADAITYSVHDLFDFYRAGLIDVGRLEMLTESERTDIARRQEPPSAEQTKSLALLLLSFSGWGRYDDSRKSRSDVQRVTSHLITTLLSQHQLQWSERDGWQVEPDHAASYVMDFFKGLTRRYVIDSDTLAVTQVGHRRVVRRLFKMYIRSLVDREYRIFPSLFRSEAQLLGEAIREAGPSKPTGGVTVDDEETAAAENEPSWIDPIDNVPPSLRVRAGRLAADVVASLTDRQALSLHVRVSGLLPQDGFAGQRDA